MKYKRTSIFPYMTCCICGKKVGVEVSDSYLDSAGIRNYESVVTKRNTKVVFHNECYKQLLEERNKL